MSLGRYYITTPLYYVNDVPHLGHAFEVIGIDVQARYRRLIGHEVFFLSGTDEHGQKIAGTAEAKGLSPQEFTDRITAEFLRVWDLLGISHDDFIRTTEPRHHRAVHHLWRVVRDTGDIYLGKYEGWYDVKEEAFITESEMREKGLEPDGVRIRRMSEDAYFFKLEKYRERVRAFIEANPDFVQPESRRNEVLNSFLANPIPDLCVSRTSITWGIPVPEAPGHVVYVWFDALTNYASAVGLGDPAQADRFAKWWPADMHVIGKDILKFHCVIWPAMLLAAGMEPPRHVFGHGFITILNKADGGEEGVKMSKSLGNAVNPLAYVERFGAEPLRYFLMREMNYGGDGSFSDEAMENRYNGDLANNLGNLLSRTAGMVEKYLAGKASRTADADRTIMERTIVASWEDTVKEYEAAMPAFEYHRALARIFEFVDLLNRSINDAAPWALAKDPANEDRLRIFLSTVIEGLAHVSVLLEPFMPDTSERMRATLGIASRPEWRDAVTFGGIFSTTKVTKGEPLFPRLETSA